MADVLQTAPQAQAQCPGWPHDHDPKSCVADKKTHQWSSNRRETTWAELQQHRQRAHGRLGLLTFGDEADE